MPSETKIIDNRKPFTLEDVPAYLRAIRDGKTCLLTGDETYRQALAVVATAIERKGGKERAIMAGETYLEANGGLCRMNSRGTEILRLGELGFHTERIGESSHRRRPRPRHYHGGGLRMSDLPEALRNEQECTVFWQKRCEKLEAEVARLQSCLGDRVLDPVSKIELAEWRAEEARLTTEACMSTTTPGKQSDPQLPGDERDGQARRPT